MKIEFLEWDSNFFKKTIGKIEINKLSDELQLAEVLATEKENYDLIYLFSPEDILLPENTFFTNFTLTKVDTKVIYSWQLKTNKKDLVENTRSSAVINYSADKLSKELALLVYDSGIHSRYFTDPNFSIKEFENMYYIWAEKSLKREIADYFFVTKEKAINSFVTLKINKNRFGTIGLISVNKNLRGKGIGSQLLDKVKLTCIKHKLLGFTVATQKANTNACRFYEKNGCVVLSKTNVYHLWRK